MTDGRCPRCSHAAHDPGECETFAVRDPGPGQWEDYCACGTDDEAEQAGTWADGGPRFEELQEYSP